MKEIVIAAYEREYSRWVQQLNSDIKVTVYRKGNNHSLENEIYLENNVGRDIHTFFYHLAKNYNNLSDYTFMSQDDFTFHVSNYIEILNGDVELWDKNAIQKFGETWFFCTSLKEYPPQRESFIGPTLDCDKSGFPDHGGLPIEKIWNELFKVPCPNTISFPPGGHFCVSKEHVRKRPLYFYKKIVDILENNPSAPWVFERIEPYVFNTNYKIK
jgi:hypothetical protein